jgi:hypothetical protein
MKPLKQRNRHKPKEGIYGDCHRAAIASILELPLDGVPNFGEGLPDNKEFQRREREWLLSRGLVPISVPYRADLEYVLKATKVQNPGVYYLLGGQSRTGVGHTVVCFEDEIVFDPSIDDSGIIGPFEDDGLYWLTFFGSAVSLKREVPCSIDSGDASLLASASA